TLARNFMTELDALFNLDPNLESLDKTVTEKKHAVTTQAQELEALQKRLREAEERLNHAKGNSPPRKDAHLQSPTSTTNDTAPTYSPLAARHPQTMDIP
ncbi:hypothetical protein N0V94_009741, partial [Neodidymelliopsis sp. IMI 364377]